MVWLKVSRRRRTYSLVCESFVKWVGVPKSLRSEKDMDAFTVGGWVEVGVGPKNHSQHALVT